MTKQKTRTCPSCKQKYNDPPAISRVDDYTLICPECGTREAIAVFVAARKQHVVDALPQFKSELREHQQIENAIALVGREYIKDEILTRYHFLCTKLQIEGKQ